MAWKTRNCRLCKNDFAPVSANQKICRECRKTAPCIRCELRARVQPGSYCSTCTKEMAKDRKESRMASKLCVDCGTKEAEPNTQRCGVCLVDRSIFSADKYQAVKHRAVLYLGGKCVDCGLKTDRIEVYDFHHLDPSLKESGVCDLLKAAWDVVLAELDKCILLCSNCHRSRERDIDYQRLRQRCLEAGILVPAFLTN